MFEFQKYNNETLTLEYIFYAFGCTDHLLAMALSEPHQKKNALTT